MPFDRLVKGVESLRKQGLLPERVIAQVGDGGYRPEGWEVHERLPFDDVRAILDKADIVFCHGGTGSLVTGCKAGCRVIAFPRDPERNEHNDNHQEEIVTAFAERGLIQTARTKDDHTAALASAPATASVRPTTKPQKLL